MAAARKTDDHVHRACWRYLRSPIKLWRKRAGRWSIQANFVSTLFRRDPLQFGDCQAWLQWTAISILVDTRLFLWTYKHSFDSSLADLFPLYTSSPSCHCVSTSKIQPTNSTPSDMPEKLYTQPTLTDPIDLDSENLRSGSARTSQPRRSQTSGIERGETAGEPGGGTVWSRR